MFTKLGHTHIITDKLNISALDDITIGTKANHIETIKGRQHRLLGGSGIYFSLASSLFSKTHLIGIVGDDFNQDDIEMLHAKAISTNYLGHEKGKTFSWGGKYSNDFSHRDTLFTELGVFQDFKPIIDTSQLDKPILFLANIQPSLQMSVLNQVDNLKGLYATAAEDPESFEQVSSEISAAKNNIAEMCCPGNPHFQHCIWGEGPGVWEE